MINMAPRQANNVMQRSACVLGMMNTASRPAHTCRTKKEGNSCRGGPADHRSACLVVVVCCSDDSSSYLRFQDQYSVCGACVGSNHRATERALLLAAVWALALASFVLHSNTPTNSNICLGPRSAAAVGDPISISSTP
jgi:hypothetical protein